MTLWEWHSGRLRRGETGIGTQAGESEALKDGETVAKPTRKVGTRKKNKIEKNLKTKYILKQSKRFHS